MSKSSNKLGPEDPRIPRPIGTTYMAMSYQKDPTPDAKSQLIKHIINSYITQGFRLNGTSYNLTQISILLNIPLETTLEVFSDVSHSLGALLSPEKIEDTLRTAMTMSLTWSLQDKGRLEKQVELLLKSQGDGYKPFITSEVNKALKSNLDANKNIMDFFKTLTTANTTVVQIFNGSKKEQGDTLNTLQALKLIQDQASLPAPQKTNILDNIYNEHNLDQIEELNTEKNTESSSVLVNNKELKEQLNRDSKALGQEVRDQITSSAQPYRPPTKGSESLIAYPEKAIKPLKKGTHQDFFRRRGLDIQDVDLAP